MFLYFNLIWSLAAGSVLAYLYTLAASSLQRSGARALIDGHILGQTPWFLAPGHATRHYLLSPHSHYTMSHLRGFIGATLFHRIFFVISDSLFQRDGRFWPPPQISHQPSPDITSRNVTVTMNASLMQYKTREPNTIK